MLQAFMELRALHNLFNNATRLLEETIGASCCIPNCGKCCQVNTPVARVIEAINMVSAVGSLGHKSLKRAVQLSEEWLLARPEGVTIYGPISPLEKMYSGQIMEEWKLLAKQQCPFLLEDSSCLIHEFRPLTCRTYAVFRDAYPICPRPPGKTETLTQRAIIDSGIVKPFVKEFFSSCKKKEPEWAKTGFIPTLLFRAAQPKKFREYVNDHKIASAKLLGLSLDIDLMWQPQLDALRAGKTPIEVVLAEVLDEDEVETAIRAF